MDGPQELPASVEEAARGTHPVGMVARFEPVALASGVPSRLLAQSGTAGSSSSSRWEMLVSLASEGEGKERTVSRRKPPPMRTGAAVRRPAPLDLPPATELVQAKSIWVPGG
jgi:hypothetical protein